VPAEDKRGPEVPRPPLTLRLATVADAEAIARVHVRAWQESYRELLPAELLAGLSVERRRQAWERELANPVKVPGILIAEVTGEVVGFAAAGPAREPAGGYAGELYAIYLLAAYQGRGHGRALFAAAIRALAAQGMTSMMLWVLRDNPTRGFYGHLGGVEFAEQAIAIGGRDYQEVAYGWPALPATTAACESC